MPVNGDVYRHTLYVPMSYPTGFTGLTLGRNCYQLEATLGLSDRTEPGGKAGILITTDGALAYARNFNLGEADTKLFDVTDIYRIRLDTAQDNATPDTEPSFGAARFRCDYHSCGGCSQGSVPGTPAEARRDSSSGVRRPHLGYLAPVARITVQGRSLQVTPIDPGEHHRRRTSATVGGAAMLAATALSVLPGPTAQGAAAPQPVVYVRHHLNGSFVVAGVVRGPAGRLPHRQCRRGNRDPPPAAAGRAVVGPRQVR